MDKRIEGGWPENQMQLQMDRGTPFFPNSYDVGSFPPFASSSYPASLMASSFPNSNEISPHTASTPGSFESLPAHISTGQLYEESSNDSSVFSGPVFTGTVDSSSMTSAGLDASSDGSSRKDSLSSTYDGHLPSDLLHSPEIESVVWPSASTSAVQSIPYGLCYGANNTASNAALHSTSLYDSTDSMSQSMNAYKHQETMQMITPANLSSLQIDGPSHSMHNGGTMSISLPARTTSNSQLFPSPTQATTMSLQAPKSNKSNAKSRSSTSGSTRRAKFQRSRTGCMVCRKRKVKCDQDGQPCKQCRIGKRDCHYEDNPQKRKRISSKSKSDSGSIPKGRDSSSEADSVEINLAFLPAAKSLSSASLKEEARRRIEEEDELKRASDALFAQHTNFDQVEGDDEDHKARMTEAAGLLQHSRRGKGADSFSMSDNPSMPWVGQTDTTASTMTTNDWSTDTHSTGPSSLRTNEEDAMHFVHLTETIDTNHTKATKLESSPFHTFLDLDDESHGTQTVDHPAAEDIPWYRSGLTANEINDSTIGVEHVKNEGS